MLRSVWRVWFVTYQGAFVMVLRIFDCALCMIAVFATWMNIFLFFQRPEWQTELFSSLFKTYMYSFCWAKTEKREENNYPPSTAEVKRMEFCTYKSFFTFACTKYKCQGAETPWTRWGNRFHSRLESLLLNLSGLTQSHVLRNVSQQNSFFLINILIQFDVQVIVHRDKFL